jgi:hypothetical protein
METEGSLEVSTRLRATTVQDKSKTKGILGSARTVVRGLQLPVFTTKE